MTRIILVGIFTILATTAFAAETETATPKNSSSFSSSSFSKSSGPSRIPGTGGAGGGNPSPISAGFAVIAAGSFIYLAKRIRDDIKTK